MNVVFVNCTIAYPTAFFAENTKTAFDAMGLVENGAKCTIINHIAGSADIKQTTRIDVDGVAEVITYPMKGHQLVSWIGNTRRLDENLRRLYVKGDDNILVTSFQDLHLFYAVVHCAGKNKYKIVSVCHEWNPTITTFHPLRRSFANYYAAVFGKYVDGILPISEYIIKKISHFKKPYLKLPILSDFSKERKRADKSSGFVYCVSAEYYRVIKMCVDAYCNYENEKKEVFPLTMVISGSHQYQDVVKTYIREHNRFNNIVIKTKLPYDELIELYANATALLIPLDPSSEQDEARFSQKIAEYLSSGTPIISNKVGEINYYFEDKKNIILSDYSVDGFCETFEWITTHQREAAMIGKAGFELGKREFNYAVYGKKLKDFFEEICH